MTDDLPLARRRMFRKRRKHVGDDIANAMTPERATLEAAQRDSGIYCREERKVVRYVDLSIAYERQGTDMIRCWICRCGNVIREDNLEAMTNE